ncbi:hypothetical protein [Cryobacterium mannosilyticum]|uniref:Fimbrial assembly protein n=1 Tax=Cryobacterium mannosilyticum TaxID=1259190 RepID=A0A4R8WC24_9MICO|nr:hypothetical protein [Cryobacterium mannosilyticum]TFC04613.1 hypothetical protein E3O32_07815 [Cryobacterium mannosilyticum]
MSRNVSGDELLIGGEPRVDLLPPEVLKRRKAKAIRRGLGIGVVGLLVVVAAGIGAATVLSAQAQLGLLAEQSHTAGLLAEQTKYGEVRTAQAQVDLVKAAQRVGVSTEIDWKPYLQGVQATLPPSVSIKSVTVDSATPILVYEQPTAPLQGARVATVTFSATSNSLPDVPTWLTGLAALPGFADALPGQLLLDEATGIYTVDITMHINDAAFAERFAAKEK